MTLLRVLFITVFALFAQPVSAAEPRRFSVTGLADDTLVIERVTADGRATEGVVVDARRLVQTLESRVIGARGLGSIAHLELARAGDAAGEPVPAEAAAYVFSHRCSPPFQALSVALRLDRLADPDEGDLVYPLAFVLVMSIVAGLYALYLMAATQVAFAERRSNFVSAVSHELKTPLTAIRMHAEMLEEDLVSDDAKRHEYYRTITRESERLTRLIDNVLAFSRLEKKTQKLELVVGDMGPVVEECVSVLRPHAEREGFVLESKLTAGLAPVRFEADALKQVLFNLVDNAVKYGKDGARGHIRVECGPREGGVLVSVSDLGPGLPPSQLELVFEPFYRAEAELTRRQRGTGIGLSLVRELMVAMGGQVRAENTHPGLAVRCEFPSV